MSWNAISISAKMGVESTEKKDASAAVDKLGSIGFYHLYPT